MTKRRFTKADVDTHYDHGRSHPAFNVKVYTYADDKTARKVATDNGYDPDEFIAWLEATYPGNYSDWDLPEWTISTACEDESEYFRDWIAETFDRYNVKSWHEGRSSGWIVVDGLPDVDDWDAIMVSKWGKMVRVAREIADGIPYQALNLLLMNEYDEYERARKADEASTYID